MDLGLEGKVVIVTGGANGIGEATTKIFAEEGAIPFILDKDREKGVKLEEDLRERGYKVYFLETNLTEKIDCESKVEYIAKRLGRIDVLINNAGANNNVGFAKGIEPVLKEFHDNVDHYLTMTGACLPHLESSGGNIINISSAISFTGEGESFGYTTAKGAINSLTRQTALYGSSRNVRCNAIAPSTVKDTKMYQEWLQTLENPEEVIKKLESTIPLGQRSTTPEEIANMIAFLASNKVSGHTTGQIVHVDGGDTHLDRRFNLF